MRVTILGSGSEGNALLLESGDTRVLVDAGLSFRKLSKRFQAVGRRPPVDVAALVVTHGHGDHAAHASTYAARFGCTVRGTETTLRGLRRRPSTPVETFRAGRAFRVGDIAVHTCSVPHDAPQVALRFEATSGCVGLVTDLGHAPRGLARFLDGCDLLLIESNHDLEMLEDGPYPAPLKRRVGGPLGHLSNAQTADLLADLPCTPKDVVLMHLSATNNTPERARCSADAALGHAGTRLHVARQRHPTELTTAPASQLQLAL